MYDRPSADGCPDPVGPQPEQIRLLTYLALATGCKALGFWSDRFLADSHQGSERLLQLAMLNQEIEMLEPLLLNTDRATSAGCRRRTRRSRWRSCGRPGRACWPCRSGSAAGPSTSRRRAPLRADVHRPARARTARSRGRSRRSGCSRCRTSCEQTPDGTQITLPEFDLTAAVVFTNDNAPDGLLAAWQKKTRDRPVRRRVGVRPGRGTVQEGGEDARSGWRTSPRRSKRPRC